MRQSSFHSERFDENLAGKRKWRQHEGRNRFFCDGRVMVTKQNSVFLFTLFLIVLTFTLFCVFDVPYLTAHVSVALPIIASILFLIVISSLLKTSFTDPGILPRPSNREAIQYDMQSQDPAETSRSNNSNGNRVKQIVVNGQPMKLKFCFTCRLYRPPRASHCSTCDNCVLNFDHHCPWIGNCVGLRNYRYFYFFITSLAFLDFFIGACTTVHIALLTNETSAFMDAVRRSPISLVVALISIISIWSIVGLSGFHTYLLATSQTTNEDIKGTFNTKLRPSVKNPFSTGNFCKNIWMGLCGPELPSLLDRRGIIQSDVLVTVDEAIIERMAPIQQQAHSDAEENTEPTEVVESKDDDEIQVEDTECMPRHSFVSIPTPNCSTGAATTEHVEAFQTPVVDAANNHVSIPMQSLERESN